MARGWTAAAALALIRAYQRAGGGERLFGVQCDFTPSCSEYARQAIERHGLGTGLRLGWARIRRCRGNAPPYSLPDPVPDRLP